MRLTKSGGRTAVGPEAWFTGTVYIDSIRNPDEQSCVGCADVRGSRLAPEPGGIPIRRARPCTSPTASGTSVVGVAKCKRSCWATSSSSSRTRSTGRGHSPPVHGARGNPGGRWQRPGGDLGRPRDQRRGVRRLRGKLDSVQETTSTNTGQEPAKGSPDREEFIMSEQQVWIITGAGRGLGTEIATGGFGGGTQCRGHRPQHRSRDRCTWPGGQPAGRQAGHHQPAGRTRDRCRSRRALRHD